MKRIFLLFSILLMLVSVPITSLAATTNLSEMDSMIVSDHTDSATFEFEGVTYTLTLKVTGDYQEAIINDGKTIETVSYDSSKDQLRFNGELVSDEELESMKGIVNEASIQDDSIKIDNQFQALAAQNIPYKLVKSNTGSLNITTATVLAVTGLILLIPTGTGTLAGVVLTAKIIAVLASAIVSSVQSTGHKYVYFKFDTYFKNQGGYWWNKYVLSVYQDSKRTKLIKSVSHETKYGKKYSFNNLEKGNLIYSSLYV